MARITTHQSAADAYNYYLADYLTASTAMRGRWLGDGAKRLGLSGEVDPEHFKSLLSNRHPFNDTKLSVRDKDNRRVGWDVNFNIPKSVSIAFGLNQADDIVDAMRQSVNETLADMENDVMVRVNPAPGVQRHELSRNFISAVFIHPEARAVDGHVPDPQLHAHAFISNHSFANNRWLAADISNLFRDAQGYYEYAFQSRLADRLQAMGYQIERSERNFEIVGISRELIEKFSKRSGEINRLINEEHVAAKIAAKEGISLDDAKGKVGALSRNAKDKHYELDELFPLWDAQLTTQERQVLDQLRENKETPTAPQPVRITAQQAVDYALEHGFTKEAVLRERNVLKDALKQGIVGNTVQDIIAELARRNLVRNGLDAQAILTTKELQAEEMQIVDFARNGRGSVKPLHSNHRIQRQFLSDEQKQAVTGLLESTDRLQILRGIAGVGKTTLLQEVLPAITSTGRSVAVMAPTNKATNNLIADGFRATTMQSFLKTEKAQSQIKGGVIIVDEAGQIGSPSFNKLSRIAEQQGARIIAVGDRNQHLPVERGHPLKLLEKQAGITPKTVSKIRRQSGAYKEAVGYLARHEIAEGLNQLNELQSVYEIADESRNSVLAKDYADAKEAFPKDDLLVIAPTHAERRQVTDAIRQELKSRKLIKGKERELTTLIARDLDIAQRRDPLNFHVGDVLAFHSKAQNHIQPGEQYTVSKVTQDKVFLDGNKEAPLESAGAFSVFRPETSHYAVGDIIRLTRGRRQQGDRKELTNGKLHTIKSFRKGLITLDNGEKLPSNWRFFDHGIAVTSHVAQGTTVHRAFVAASSLSFPASSPEQMYVSASRAKKQVRIYTDSFDGLLNAAQRHRPKQLATSVTDDQHVTQSQVTAQPMPNASTNQQLSRLTRIRKMAQRFATKQLQRLHDWLPDNHLQPQLER